MSFTDTLNHMTVAELRKLAARFDITGRSKMTKAQLVRELADPDIADVVELAISVAETEEIMADAYAVAAIEEADAENADERTAAIDEEDETPIRVKIERHRPGGGLASIASADGIRNAWVRRAPRGKGWILTDTYDSRPVRVKAVSFEKLAKAWARKLGVRVEIIDVVKTF